MSGGYETEDRVTDILLDEDGRPPCAQPDACSTCRLFSTQRPDEDRATWLERMIGAALGRPLLDATPGPDGGPPLAVEAAS